MAGALVHMAWRSVTRLTAAALTIVVLTNSGARADISDQRYLWQGIGGAGHRPADTLAARIAPPPGFLRRPVAAGSFAAWLRGCR